MRPRLPTSAVVEGPAVVVSGRVAVALARLLNEAIALRRSNNGGVAALPDEVAAAVDALRFAGSVWLESQSATRQTKAPVARELPQPEVPASSTPMSTAEVADFLRVSDRRVRQLAQERRLPAIGKDAGAYRFRREDVEDFRRGA